MQYRSKAASVSAAPYTLAAAAGTTLWERLLVRGVRLFSGNTPEQWAPSARVALESRCYAPAYTVPIVAFSALSVVFELAGVFSLLPLLQYIQAGQDLGQLAQQSSFWRRAIEWSSAAGVPIRIWSLALLTLALILARQLVFYLANLRAAQVRENVTRHLRLDLAERLMRARPAAIQSIGSGAFVTMLSSQTLVASSIVVNLGQIVMAVLSFIAYAVGIALVSPGIILMGAASAVIVVLLLQRFVRATFVINHRMVAEGEELGRFLSQFYQAWRLVKLTDQLAPMLGQLNAKASALQASNLALARNGGRVQLLAMPIAAALALLILTVATSVLKLSIAELSLILVVLFRLGPMAEQFVRLRQAQTSVVSTLNRLDEVRSMCTRELEADMGSRSFAPPGSAICLRGVSYRYPGRERTALTGIDLDIPANRMTAVIGPSGAGKTTLLDMLPRLLAPDEGSIMIDDVPVAELRLRELRRGIAVVDQHSVLFDATVEENLRFAKPDADEAELHAALEQAGALDIIAALPEGLQARVGENGARLSGGQRQRLAIARAFLGGARVLVLDEPTSALDFEAEAQFRRTIRMIRQVGRTTIIVVAHRPSTIKDADLVVVLRDGRVEEAAPPADLTREQSYYARMIEADLNTPDRTIDGVSPIAAE